MSEVPKQTGQYTGFGESIYLRKKPRGTRTDWHHRPDRCDGSYEQYCGMSPRFDNITDVLESSGNSELVEFMNRYWVAK